jgi:hypothetical protein
MNDLWRFISMIIYCNYKKLLLVTRRPLGQLFT